LRPEPEKIKPALPSGASYVQPVQQPHHEPYSSMATDVFSHVTKILLDMKELGFNCDQSKL